MKYLMFIVLVCLNLHIDINSSEALKDKTWHLSGITDLAKHQNISFKGDFPLQFSDSTLKGTACNPFRAKYTVENNNIKITKIAITERGCLDEESRLAEDYILKYFYSIKYKITADTLHLLSDSNVVFTYYAKN